MNAQDHYQEGRLLEAVAAALGEVKMNPSDVGKRRFLCELLCFTGDLERADRQLEALKQMVSENPDDLVSVCLFQQLIRAEQARQQFYSDGRLPEFLKRSKNRKQLQDTKPSDEPKGKSPSDDKSPGDK